MREIQLWFDPRLFVIRIALKQCAESVWLATGFGGSPRQLSDALRARKAREEVGP